MEQRLTATTGRVKETGEVTPDEAYFTMEVQWDAVVPQDDGTALTGRTYQEVKVKVNAASLHALEEQCGFALPAGPSDHDEPEPAPEEPPAKTPPPKKGS